MAQYVAVSEREHDEPIELPAEEDGWLLLSTLAAQFAGACGLRYRAGGRVRGPRALPDRLAPPPEGWAAHRYWCAFPREPEEDEPPPRCRDLVVLGLPWRTGEDAVRAHFSALGELEMVQVKRDPATGLSKGFGFVKFAEYSAQRRALGRRHLIDGRWCDVRVPGAQHRKVFVGRCSESLSAEDLREYFSAFGPVADVFVPRPFRAFCFVTFAEADTARALCGRDHIIKGVSVSVAAAAPRRAPPATPVPPVPAAPAVPCPLHPYR